jgi:hypothetical protein
LPTIFAPPPRVAVKRLTARIPPTRAKGLYMWGDLVQVMMDLARVVCSLLCLLCPERVLRITCKRLPKEAEPWS